LKQTFKSFFIIIFLFLSIVLPVGQIGKVQAATIQLSSTSFALEVNHYKTLYVSGTSKKVTWSSSKSSVAAVSSTGRVTAKAPGTATIYASVSGKKLACKVTVIKLSSSSATIAAGSRKTLKIYGTASKITWSSGNKTVATVSTDGSVTARAPGTATIYASVLGKKLTCKITVIKLNSSSLTLYKGNSKTLKVSGTSAKITWSTSSSAIASVSQYGVVTAKAAGTATITASVSGVKLTSKITVKNPTVTTTPTPTPNPTISPSVPPTVTPTAAPDSTTQELASATSAKIIGYYAAWSKYSGYTPDQIDAKKLTHLNYAFANIGSDLRITLGYPDIDPSNISKLNQLKQINPNLKTIISVGGWSWSGRFSDAALTEESRTVFAQSCVDFIVKYGFDGVDIDWEYPVSGGLSTNVKRPEDKYNFTLLLKTVREKLDARGEQDGKNYLLTFAGAAGSWYTRNTELSNISQYVDYANIMTYDIHGTWEPYTNFNAPLYSNDPLQPYKISVDTSIQDWLKAGFPKNKLIMGVPFYGFIYKAVVDVNHGLYQTYSGGASISYANIAANYLNAPGYVRYYHSDSRVPWLFNGSTFITYEDEQSMAEKAKYLKQNGLNGVMIWELSQDPNKVLLNSLYQELSK
jgi:chitinase